MGHHEHDKYWQRFMLPGENAVHTFGVSGFYIVLFWGVPFVLLLVMTIVASFSAPVLGVLFFIPAMAATVPMIYLRYFVHYAVTDRRVMGREGIFHKRFITVDLRSITDVTINEPLLERLITKTGLIGVNTAGSPNVELYYRHVRRPLQLRKDIYHHLQRAINNHGQIQVQRADKR